MATPVLDKHLDQLGDRLKAINKTFFKAFNQDLSTKLVLLEGIHSNLISMAGIISGLKEGSDRENQIIKFHSTNLELLKQEYISISSETSLNKIIKDFSSELEQYLETTPEKLSIELPSESLKRKLKKTERQKLRVHFKKLVKGYLLPLYFERITSIVKDSQTIVIDSFATLFEVEHAFTQNAYTIKKEKLSKLSVESKGFEATGPDGFFGEYRTELEKYILRSGIFFSKNMWQNMGGSLDYTRSREGLAKAGRSWQSTFFALFEDWRLHEQLFVYLHKVQLVRLNVEEIYSKRIKSSLVPEVTKQLEYTSGLLANLPDPDSSDMESIRTFFVSELYRLKKRKTNEDKEIQLLQAAEDLPKLLQKLEIEALESLNIFPEKAGVVSIPKYRAGIRPSEIYYFSPGEFIQVEYLHNFRSSLAQQQKDLEKDLQVIINEFSEYDQIIDFYLDSAIALTEKPGMLESEVITFFRDGLHRLLNISNKISEQLKRLKEEKLSEMSTLVKAYVDQVSELDNNDNIIRLYTRLLRSKALAESKTRREKLVDFFKRTMGRLSLFFGRHNRWLQSSYSDLKKKLRLDSTPAPISSDISNYLTDILKRVYKLPLIYQHLFENIPVREFNLFLSREDEINRLNAAYNDWLKDNFAASLVIGENGSGKSSLLHYYSSTLKTNYKIREFQVSDFYYTEDDFYGLIREIFTLEELNNDESLSAYISSFTERQIVIIDGLERLFLRKVNGFLCLQKLLSLIVSSNHQIFWICSVSKYASAYLNKTMGLSEYFDYIVEIDTLDSKQIRDIVLKRNRLSGYELSYQNGSGTDESARSKDLSQSDLEDRFFAELNQFAGSNISLSLNYWLQSIHSIEEDHIEIEHFLTPDFGFLDSISPEKAYTLLVILMHGKISLEQHAHIFNQPVDRSYRVLSILKEDSVLVKHGEYFTLNGILFRHVVKMLENRNLIH